MERNRETGLLKGENANRHKLGLHFSRIIFDALDYAVPIMESILKISKWPKQNHVES